ncbi:hypothetical protein COU77_04285 [Candidatus Peregrinibacteria bacterium CG10_big_fil_rev_8_21_14_0_10_49_16]|nr:MAG: hypothetical protein COU77_04285 [Candidatus Peregrinibacteria bacterium CG10_big_fil_rev_8_21_14_0_10_49_16]
MTTTGTLTETFTRTDARFLASRIASDLEQVHIFYPGLLSAEAVADHIREVVELLAYRYMDCADYGFKRNGEWIFRLRYKVRWDGWVVRNDESGGIPATINTVGAVFNSYMQYTDAFNALTTEQRLAFKKTKLPWVRVGATETPLATGPSASCKTYGRNGVSIDRNLFIAS